MWVLITHCGIPIALNKMMSVGSFSLSDSNSALPMTTTTTTTTTTWNRHKIPSGITLQKRYATPFQIVCLMRFIAALQIV
jgi:hypothetical protein